MRPAIEQFVKGLSLSDGPHWMKIVYSQIEGKPSTVSASLDNAEDGALTEKLKALPWPAAKGFYMAKEFIIVE